MKRQHLTLGIVALVGLACVALWPAFLLPAPLYDLLYGWRYPKVWTCGSATITDAGPAAASDRYVVDLGEVPLTEPTTRQYRLCELPESELFVGLHVPIAAARSWEAETALAARAALSITVREGGRTLLHHDGNLSSEWTWSGPYGRHAFVYRRPGLTLRRAGRYDVLVQVREVAAPGLRTSLVLTGGGWK